MVVSRYCLFGSGLILSKCFGSIAGLHTKYFNNTKSNNFFFRDVHLLCYAVTFVSKVMAIFLQLVLLANTATFGCYLLRLFSNSF